MCPCENGEIPKTKPESYIVCDACTIAFMTERPGEIVTDHHSSTVSLADGISDLLREAADEADNESNDNR
jgi:hypothetical protein